MQEMNRVELLINKIEEKDPKHAAKLRKNLGSYGDDYFQLSNRFFKQYENYLSSIDLNYDFGIECYLKMSKDMLEERIEFIKTGNYSNQSFEEVEKSVYANPEVMTYHMHGLVLGQFLWFEQYERIRFFRENLPNYFSGTKYLEIGGGHGLYINEALQLLPAETEFDLVDISESSLKLAKGILNNNEINYYLKNIFDFDESNYYDFITIGEVIEHVEDPLQLLAKLNNHLNNKGMAYITTPINSPMIDHIYLFNNEDEIRELLREAGFEVVKEKIVISEKMKPEMATKFKVPVMYAAFVKKLNS